jgi:hypothetical protein
MLTAPLTDLSMRCPPVVYVSSPVHGFKRLLTFFFIFGVLTPLSAIFQLYHGDYVSSYENVTKMKISTTKIEK